METDWRQRCDEVAAFAAVRESLASWLRPQGILLKSGRLSDERLGVLRDAHALLAERVASWLGPGGEVLDWALAANNSLEQQAAFVDWEFAAELPLAAEAEEALAPMANAKAREARALNALI